MFQRGVSLATLLCLVLFGQVLVQHQSVTQASPQLSEIERPMLPREWGDLKASDGLWFIFEDAEGTIRAFDSTSNRAFVHRRSRAPAGPLVPLQPAEPPSRIRVAGNIQESRLISRVEPQYPDLARQARIQGTVRLQAVIATDGTVSKLEVVSGHPLLVQAALDAVRKWRYQETLLDGTPVEVATTISVVFTLQ